MSAIRKIYVVGEINDDSYLAFTKKLDKLEAESIAPIVLELCSEGGSAYSGMAFAGKIRACRCKIFVHAYGVVMSAATAILAAADKRTVDTDCLIMIHDEETKVNGPEADVTKALVQMRKEEQQWADFFESVTGTPSKVWRDMSEATTYLRAEEALQLGLVDNISKSFDKTFKTK